MTLPPDKRESIDRALDAVKLANKVRRVLVIGACSGEQTNHLPPPPLHLKICGEGFAGEGLNEDA